MVDEVQGNINVNIDTSDAIASLRRLQGQISKFHTDMAKGGGLANREAANLQQNLINTINKTGQFSASMTKVASSTEAFTTALEKNKLSMGQHFRYAMASTKTFGRAFISEFSTIQKVAESRVRTLQTQFIGLGRDANGAMQAIKVRPLTLDMKDLATQTQIAAQKAQIFNKLVDQGAVNLLNWGKNTQWAGRQLMVGFTIPLTMFAATASKAFMDLEKQVIAFKRVYGDFSTTQEQTDAMAESVKNLANEFTQYGIAVKDTMELAAKAAAMGKTGADLTAQIKETSRLAVLGQVDQQQALDTTISLTNAFGTAADDLAGKIDFLNAVENQTVTSIEDLTIAIPKAGPVIKQMGGNVEDLSFLLTAMREGGINASEGANALKSGLAALINPTKTASDMLAGYGINVQKIVQSNKGDVKGLITEFAASLDQLDPLQRAKAIEQMFGKFQFSRISTLFQNVIKEGSQAQQVLKLANSSTQELAILSQRELSKVSESTTYKFEKAITDFQTALAPVGEQFLKLVTPIIEFGTKMLEKFNGLDEGVKGFITTVVAGVGVVGPVLLMTVGLFANAIANIIMVVQFLRKAFSGTAKGSQDVATQTEYMTQAQLVAESAAAGLNQVHARLIQTYNSEAGALQNLTRAYQNAARQAGLPIVGAPGAGKGGTKTPPVPMGRKYANGVVSVPGPKGKGDVVPAMLSPGEAVIPAAMAKKYGGLIHGMIADSIPGYKFGWQDSHMGGDLDITDPKVIDQIDAKYPGFKNLDPRDQALVAAKGNLTVALPDWMNQDMREGVGGGVDPDVFNKEWNKAKGKLGKAAVVAGVDISSEAAKLIVQGLEDGIGQEASRLARLEGTPVFDRHLDAAAETILQRASTSTDAAMADAGKKLLAQKGTVGTVRANLGKDANTKIQQLVAEGRATVTEKNVLLGSTSLPIARDDLPGSSRGTQQQMDQRRAAETARAEWWKRYQEGQATLEDKPNSMRGASFSKGSMPGSYEGVTDARLERLGVPLQILEPTDRSGRLTKTGNSQAGVKVGTQIADDAIQSVEDGVTKGFDTATQRNSPPRQAIDAGTDYGNALTSGVRSTIDDAKATGAELGQATIAGTQASKDDARKSGQRVSRRAQRGAGTPGGSNYTTVTSGGTTSIIIPADPTVKNIKDPDNPGNMISQVDLDHRNALEEDKQRTRAMRRAEAQRRLPKAYGIGARARQMGTKVVGAFGAQASMGLGMGISAAGMGLSMIPGLQELGTAVSLVGPLFMMMSPALAGVIAGLGLLGFGVFKLMENMDKAKEAGNNLANSMTMTQSKLQGFAELTGTVSATESRQAAQASRVAGPQTDRQKAFGETFLASDTGKSLIADIATQRGAGLSSRDIASSIGTQLSTAIAQGVLTTSQAKSIAVNLGTELKDYSISTAIEGKITSIVGPNGENLAKDPLQVTMAITQSTNENLDKLSNQYNNRQVDGGKIAGNIAGGAAIGAGVGAAAAGTLVAGGALMAATGTAATGMLGAAAATAVGAGWTGVGLIAAAGLAVGGIVAGVIEWNNVQAENLKLATATATAYTSAYQQNIGMLDIINQQYDQKVAEQEANLEAATTDQQRKKILEDINRIEADRAYALDVQKGQSRELLDNLIKYKSQMGTDTFNNALKGNLETIYKDDAATLAVAQDALTKINALPAVTKAEQDFQTTLQMQLVSKELDPFTAQTILTAAANNKDFGNNYNLGVAAFGDAKQIELIQTLASAGANGTTISAVLNTVVNNPEQFDSYLEGINVLQTIQAKGGVEIDINSNPEELTRIKGIVDQLKKVKGKITLTILQRVIGNDAVAQALWQNKEFQKLPRKQQVDYAATYTAVLDMQGNPSMQTAFANWLQYHPGETWDAFAKWIAGNSITKTPKAPKLDPTTPTSTSGGSSGSSAPKEDKRLARWNRQLDIREKAMRIISLKEEEINKKYEERRKVLEEIAKMNERAAQQQKEQLTLADALSRGDIAAAARAAQDMRANNAARAMEDQKAALDKAQQNEVDALSVGGKTKKQLEDEINRLELKIAQREYRLAKKNKGAGDSSSSGGGGGGGTPDKPKNPKDKNKFKNLDVYAPTNTKEAGATMAKAAAYARNTVGKFKYKAQDPLGTGIVQYSDPSGKIISKADYDKAYQDFTTKTKNAMGTFQMGWLNTMKEVNGGAQLTTGNLARLAPTFKTVADGLAKQTNGNIGLAKNQDELANALRDAGYKVKDGKVTIETASGSVKVSLKNVGSYIKNLGDYGPKAASGLKAVGQKLYNVALGLGVPAKTLGPYPVATGGLISKSGVLYRSRGDVIPGFKPIGTDTVPAMLTPGEFIMNAEAVKSVGINRLREINNGQDTSNSVYTYNVTVNAQTGANADDIAQKVMQQIRNTESMRLRGNRY